MKHQDLKPDAEKGQKSLYNKYCFHLWCLLNDQLNHKLDFYHKKEHFQLNNRKANIFSECWLFFVRQNTTIS